MGVVEKGGLGDDTRPSSVPSESCTYARIECLGAGHDVPTDRYGRATTYKTDRHGDDHCVSALARSQARFRAPEGKKDHGKRR